MIQNVFCVYDSAAAAYMPPFFLPTTAMAIRVFGECVNSDDHQFGKHPDDYTLFHLGTYDDNTAKFDILEPKVSLHVGNELVHLVSPGGSL